MIAVPFLRETKGEPLPESDTLEAPEGGKPVPQTA
jgi:hypothetical protein